MKFKELVDKYNWDNVCSTFVQLYPDHEKNIEGYKQVFEELHSLKPVETKMRIVIKDVFDEYDKEYYAHVSSKDGTLKKVIQNISKMMRLAIKKYLMVLNSQIGQNGSLWILIMNLSKNILK